MSKELEKDKFGNYTLKISKYQAKTVLKKLQAMTQEEYAELPVVGVMGLNALQIDLEEIVND